MYVVCMYIWVFVYLWVCSFTDFYCRLIRLFALPDDVRPLLQRAFHLSAYVQQYRTVLEGENMRDWVWVEAKEEEEEKKEREGEGEKEKGRNVKEEGSRHLLFLSFLFC